jgi:hypothetical protein
MQASHANTEVKKGFHLGHDQRQCDANTSTAIAKSSNGKQQWLMGGT